MNKLFGAQRVLLSILATAVLIGAWWLLKGSGYPNWALLAEALAAGALYAVIVGVVQRVSGVKLMSRMATQVTFVMVPPLALIFLVLGTIFIGVATPTEGGAMGAAGAILLAGIKRVMANEPNRLNFGIIKSATESTAKLSAFVLFILLGARVFSLTFYGVNGHLWVEHLLVSLPGGQTGFLIVVNVLVFLLAFFLDFFELAFIVVPLLGPAAEKLGIDLIWFGVILGVNMQTSFMHPPFGFALFYLRSVAPKAEYVDKVTGKKMEPITTGQIYCAVPFVVRRHPVHHGRAGHRLPADGDALQEVGRAAEPGADQPAVRQDRPAGHERPRRPARPRPQPTAEDRVTPAASGCESPAETPGFFVADTAPCDPSPLPSPSGEGGLRQLRSFSKTEPGAEFQDNQRCRSPPLPLRERDRGRGSRRSRRPTAPTPRNPAAR